MSNQVYSSDYAKYYDYPGINTYSLSGDLILPKIVDGESTVVQIDFSVEDHIDDTTCIEIDDNGHLIVLRDGMYSITIILRLQIATNPATVDMEFAIDAELTRQNDFANMIMTEIITRIPARGDDSGGLYRSQTLNTIFFLKRNDRIVINGENLITEQDLTVLSSDSSLLVQKIY